MRAYSRKSSATRRGELTGRTQNPKVEGRTDLTEPPSPHGAEEEMQKHRVSNSSSKGLANQPKSDQSAGETNKYLLYKASAYLFM